MNFSLPPMSSLVNAGFIDTTLNSVSAKGSTHDAKLEKAAHEFEASMMQELLKPMRAKDPLFSADSSMAGGGDDSGDSAGVMADYGTQVMAEAISQSGGLGIAKQVITQVERDESLRASAGKAGASPSGF
ncbi:MAG: hypothetical protein ACYC46_06280 [Acidobacteriaceae bacterium]